MAVAGAEVPFALIATTVMLFTCDAETLVAVQFVVAVAVQTAVPLM